MTNEIAIILVAPQLGENIGAAARAMKNFGLCDLRIVNPRDGWPSPSAISMSVGAANLIEAAKIYTDLKSAIADLSYVYATTASSRDINKKYVLSRNLVEDLPGGRVGILFGRESSGLSNEEISFANKILTIDCDSNFSSLNIAHAVAIASYEIFRQQGHSRNLKNKENKASLAELEHFYNHLFSELEAGKFFRVPEKKEQMSNKIRNLFARIDNLSKAELQILRGIIAVLTQNKP